MRKMFAVVFSFATAFCAEAAESYNFGWENSDATFSLFLDSNNRTAFNANENASLTWVVDSTSRPVSSANFYYTLNDGNRIDLGAIESAGQSFTINANAGDVLRFYYEDATNGWSYGVWGGNLSKSAKMSYYGQKPYWWGTTLVASADSQKPAGQPLPDVLASVLIGGAMFGAFRKFRARKNASK